MSVKAKVYRVTPKLATEWLAKNENNRPLSATAVARFARDMDDGQWQMNGQPIVFNGDSLIDGQHRLSAVVKHGKPVDMLVVSGVDTSAFRTIDSGRPRSFSNVLAVRGEREYARLGSAVGLLNLYLCSVKEGGAFLRSNGYATPTKSELLTTLEAHPGIRDSLAYVASVTPKSQRKIISPPTAAFLHYVLSQKDKQVADKFMADVCSGDGVKIGSPAGLLRARLVEDATSARLGHRMDRRLVVYFAFRAWNALRTKERLTRLLPPKSASGGGRTSVTLPDLV